MPIALAISGSTACATKRFVQTTVSDVQTSVSDVNEKVDSLGNSLEQTQERVRKNENRIGEVAQTAEAAEKSAQQARQAATEASTLAKTVDAKADAMDKASRRLINEVVITEEQDNFKFEQRELPEGAKEKLDELVAQLKQDPKDVFIEIEGYTDSVGSKRINERIGLERAEAVERYLHEQHQIPLHRMNVISYGEEKPIAPNTTKAGRAQNRRVVIRVLT